MSLYFRYNFLLLVWIASTINLFGRGDSGSYCIQGSAYDSNHKLIMNKSLTVKIGDSIKVVNTDSNGQYKFSVHWETLCRNSTSTFPVDAMDASNNPDRFLKYGDTLAVLKNEWRKMFLRDDSTIVRDIHFSKKLVITLTNKSGRDIRFIEYGSRFFLSVKNNSSVHLSPFYIFEPYEKPKDPELRETKHRDYPIIGSYRVGYCYNGITYEKTDYFKNGISFIEVIPNSLEFELRRID